MPDHENNALREQCLALMAAAPIRDYSADPIVQTRVGRFFTERAEQARFAAKDARLES